MLREYLRNIRLFSRNARLLLLGTFLGTLGLGMVAVLRNLYLRRIGIADSRIGNVLSLNSLGLLTVTIPAALMMERYRLKGFLLVAGLLGTVGVFGQLVTHQVSVILFWSFVLGVGGALGTLVIPPFVMRNTGSPERVYLFGLLAVVATAGGALSIIGGGVLVWLLGDTAGVQRAIMLGGCVVGLLAGVPLLFIEEPPLERRKRTDLRTWFAGKDWRTIGKLCLPDFLIGCGAGLTIPYFPMYFETRFGIHGDRNSWISAASYLVNAVGFAAAPMFARRLGLVKSIVASQLLSIPFFAILAGTTSLPFAVAALLLRNVLMNMAQPVNSNFAMEMVPDDQRAITNCAKGVSWNASWVVSASVGGAFSDHFRAIWAWLPWRDSDPNRFWMRDGFSLSMVVTISLYLLAASCFYWFFRGQRHAATPKQAGTRKFVPAVGAADAE